ncbi:hypothetical protein ACFX5F_16185 [Flavobacterium sp. ZS1P70]|uniref:Uncharacterized protein n=1 Tax=Flavobacterium zhoui TaxID=3230414 RepID=A0ABW6IA16_9FLAO
MKNFILGVFITIMILVCVSMYIKNTSLTASLSTYRNNKEIINKDFQKAKEDYFIQQQSDNISLILFTVTILFTIFGTATFIGVKSEFKAYIKKINAKYAEQVSENHKVIVHIKNLEGDLSFETAKNISSNFDLFKLAYTNEELIEIFEITLVSCEYYSKSLIHKSNKSLTFEKSVKSILQSSIERLKELAEDNGVINLKTINFNRFISIKDNLEKVMTKEDLLNFTFKKSKLSFPTLG